MSVKSLAAYLPEDAASELNRLNASVTEIRIRAQRPIQIVHTGGDSLCGEPVSCRQMRRIALSMMEHSYYAREEELSQGFFTMHNGCRVGVCGSFSRNDAGGCSLRAIGSMCIRVAREVKDCARELLLHMCENGAVSNTIIISRPGKGKTTLLRDAARKLSEAGYAVGIADERHEIAACNDGVPSLDVGPRSDVSDGLPKHLAMEQLIRSMAPQVLVTDEIGNDRDVAAVHEAVRRGVSLLTSAHAASFEDLERGKLSALLGDGLFSLAVLLDERPGSIAGVRRYPRGEDN